MQAEILKFWAFPGGFGEATVYLARFFASVDLPSDKNILDIREYSREYRGPGENISKRIYIQLYSGIKKTGIWRPAAVS